ncbi:MAG: fmt, partial [Chloroflexi bacterium]|nr:fmt [Chloroflexota bacterium]
VIEETSIPIGQTTRRLGYPAVGTSDGLLILEELQPAGKRAMSGKDFLSGAKQWG